MDATSLFDCLDWTKQVDTYKYGRDGTRWKQKNGRQTIAASEGTSGLSEFNNLERESL
jgi:hypothetical protein